MHSIDHSPALVDRAYQELTTAIASGELRPGERIRQADLATRLGVSRQPISHALQLLKHQGLLRDAGKRGLEVVPIDAARIGGLYQVRAVIDGLAARLAAERAAARELSQEERDALWQAVVKGKELAREGTVAEVVAADVAFHKRVYRLSGNATIAETIEPQFPHLMRSMSVVLDSWEFRERCWAEHELIAREILAGTPADAGEAALRHAESSGEETDRRLKEPVSQDRPDMQAAPLADAADDAPSPTPGA